MYSLKCSLAKSLALMIGSLALMFNSVAFGGYISFPPDGPSGVMRELNFYFTMDHNPGKNANAYYAHNFFIDLEDGKRIGGYIGPQSTAIIGTDTYAIATIWPNGLGNGSVVSLLSFEDTDCYELGQSAEGHVATCVLKQTSAFAQKPMPDGTTYKVYIKSVSKTDQTMIFEFGIQNLKTHDKTVLGQMEIMGAIGIDPEISNFLEYFGSNSRDCRNLYTAYTETAPTGLQMGGDALYKFGVTWDKRNWDKDQCPNTEQKVAGYKGNPAVQVEWAISKQ